MKNTFVRYLLLITSGFIYTASFSPFDFKIGIFISIFIYFYLISNSSRKSSILESYIYGLAIFTSGVSWIFNSIYYYGGEHFLLSIMMTLVFIIYMSIFFIPIGFFINKKSNLSGIHFPLIAASMWVLMEIIRSSLFGGFPWLLVGTSQVGTIFDSLYPFMGVYSVSFMVVIISTVMASKISYQIKFRVFKIYALFISSLFLIINIIPIQSTDSHQPIKVSVIQPNIHLGLKYNESQLENIKKKYIDILENEINNFVVMPETAIPKIYQFDKKFYNDLVDKFGFDFITGIFNYDQSKDKVYNSMLMLENKKEFFYNKRHLVPFGEYTPLENIFSFIANILNIPMSSIEHGKSDQNPIYYRDTIIYPLICYEIAYSSLIKPKEDKYGLIITISNDAWFGNTFAPHQHLQIAKVRALESSLPIIRAANTGISAILDKRGAIVDKIELNHSGYINAEVFPSKGLTPYMYFGDYPILMLIFSIMLFYWKKYKIYG